MRENTQQNIDDILALYVVEEGEEPICLTYQQIQKKLDATSQELDRAFTILRGQCGNVRKLRVTHYLSVAGRGGMMQSMYALGSEPDEPRTRANTLEDRDALDAAKRTRLRAEELKLQRELDAIDNYR